MLTQLLRNMMGLISAQTNTASASREIARQMGLMLKVEQVVVCGWERQANRLAILGEFKRSLSKQVLVPSRRKGRRVGSLLNRMLNSGEPIQSRASAELSKELKALVKLSEDPGSVLFIPIHVAHGPLGLIIAAAEGKHSKFGQPEMIVGQIFANHAALILENVQLQAGAQRRTEEIDELGKACLELSSTLDSAEVIAVALKNAHRLLPDVRLARVYFCERERLELAGALAAPGLDPVTFDDPRPRGWFEDVARNGKSLYLGHVATGRPITRLDLAIISMSLQCDERMLGVIEVVYGPPLHLDEELRIARLLADQTASALENARLHAQARQAAMADILTGLPNRRSFNARLGEELRRALRYQRFFSVAMIDLDNFKAINDRYGHNVGDVALQDVARCLRYKVRDTDFLARFGGDEFVLLLPETRAAEADKLCQKLRSGMGDCIVGWTDPDREMISFSYGVAEFPSDAQDAASLMGVADKAMYGDKSQFLGGLS
ncbi:MAG: diguanylate cyclase [Anaerolineales bacterium]